MVEWQLNEEPAAPGLLSRLLRRVSLNVPNEWTCRRRRRRGYRTRVVMSLDDVDWDADDQQRRTSQGLDLLSAKPLLLLLTSTFRLVRPISSKSLMSQKKKVTTHHSISFNLIKVC